METSRASMISAIKSSQSIYFVTLCSGVPSAYHKEVHLDWFITGVRFSVLNGVLSTRIKKDDTASIIEKGLEPFKSNKVPMLWWVDQSTLPSDFENYLRAEGLTLEEESTGMALDLSKLKKEKEVPPGLQIKRVEDERMMMTWMRVAGSVFGLSAEATYDCLRLFNHGLDENARYQHYLGMLDGAAVATSSILYDKVAGIYDVATIPRARGRGIGQMMTTIPLSLARKVTKSQFFRQAKWVGEYTLLLASRNTARLRCIMQTTRCHSCRK
ncbi:MAG: GNAT family N-acetyltransferase [Nitrososphaerales archaeon]